MCLWLRQKRNQLWNDNLQKEIGMATGDVAKMVLADCPECDEQISLKSNVVWGHQVTCPHCDAGLEVINTDPVELDWVYEESDYGYEDEDEEDW
jgi:hypothetical protein